MIVYRWEHDMAFPQYRDRSNLSELLGSNFETYLTGGKAGEKPSSRIVLSIQQTFLSEEGPVFIEVVIHPHKISRDGVLENGMRNIKFLYKIFISPWMVNRYPTS